VRSRSARDGPAVAPAISSPLAIQEFTSTTTKDVQMTDATLSLTAAPTYEGTNRLILGIVWRS
jgi:DHA2 family multidrug resistance protein-like MFS transporter